MKDTILRNRAQGFRATGIVIKDSQLLMMKQVFDGEEFYTLPGGSWEQSDETLEETCRREIQEEFNVGVSVGRLIFLVDSKNRINFVFECEYIEGELELGGPERARMNQEDQYYVHWIGLDQIQDLNIIPQQAKESLVNYLSSLSQPTFYINTVNEISNKLLIVSSPHYPTPPRGYGGIERVAALAYQQYKQRGYTVDIVSQKKSPLHTYSFEQLDDIDLKQYRFVVSYYYEEKFVRLLDKRGPQTYLILQNNYSDKLAYLKELKYTRCYVLSEHQREQYFKNLGLEFGIIPNGVDMDYYEISSKQRRKDIAFIGGIGQHKSPLACLKYAVENNLKVDFYGPIIFREDEKEYELVFMKELAEYPNARLKKEVNDHEKICILQEYKYFIFLPGLDKSDWVEPFGLAALEAMACGCTVITQYASGGHLSFCNTDNTISYREQPRQLDPHVVRKSVLNYDFDRVFKLYYPK